MQENNTSVSLYVVKVKDGQFFAGFDSAKGVASYVDSPLMAKKFSNKYDIKLRPQETLIEITVDLSKSYLTLSEPFRPARKTLPHIDTGKMPR